MLSIKFTIKNIVIIALMLALFIIVKLFQKFIPSLPNGLGNLFVLSEIIIILYSFVFGFSKTLVMGILFYGILAFVAPPFFISGVTYAKNPLGFVGIYFLDYIIPFLFLASSSFIYLYKKNYFAIICGTGITIIFAYFSSVLGGVIFWGQYAWTGYTVVAYSFLANGIKSGILLISGIIIVGATVKRLRTLISKYVKDQYAKY